MKFTYDELATYVEVVNAVDDDNNDVNFFMHGAFPDNDDTPDLDAALRHAELLLANAEALRNEIRALKCSREI